MRLTCGNAIYGYPSMPPQSRQLWICYRLELRKTDEITWNLDIGVTSPGLLYSKGPSCCAHAVDGPFFAL